MDLWRAYECRQGSDGKMLKRDTSEYCGGGRITLPSANLVNASLGLDHWREGDVGRLGVHY